MPVMTHLGKIISVSSARAGAGKSTIALLLAADLAQTHNVCVVDGDLRDGVIGLMTGRMDVTVDDLFASGEISAKRVRNHLVYDAHLNLHALIASKRLRTNPHDYVEFFSQVLTHLRAMFDVIIVDTSTNYLDPLAVRVFFPMSDEIIHVSDLTVAGLWSMTRWFGEMETEVEDGGHGICPSKISLVLNKTLPGTSIDHRQITQAAAGAPIVGIVPSLPQTLIKAVNRSRISEAFANEPLRLAVDQIAQGLSLKPVCVPHRS